MKKNLRTVVGMAAVLLTLAAEAGPKDCLFSDERICNAAEECCLRGNNSAIINHKMIPDHPDVQIWSVGEVEFITGDAA